MIYAAILAGGSGTRMKSAKVPKQYIEVDGNPIILYTIENVLKEKRFNYVYIAVHADYLSYMDELVKMRVSEPGRIRVIEGGKERMDTIRNVTNAITSDNGLNDDDIIVIHDAARPFVTEKILSDSIEAAAKYGACVCALPAADTMLYSETGDEVSSIPDRSKIFHGQAPDSFNLKHFLDMQDALSPEQRAAITGTSQICTMNSQSIHMIPGDTMNFKITTDGDLDLVRNTIALHNIQL